MSDRAEVLAKWLHRERPDGLGFDHDAKLADCAHGNPLYEDCPECDGEMIEAFSVLEPELLPCGWVHAHDLSGFHINEEHFDPGHDDSRCLRVYTLTDRVDSDQNSNFESRRLRPKSGDA